MPVGYSYARFSRAEQSQGDSLRRQLERTRNFAAELGVTLDETLTDLGVSAYRGKNRIEGALGEFHRRVQSGQIERGSYLFIESLDRMSREEVIVALQPFLTLIEAGIIIATVADRQTYSRETIKKNPMILLGSLLVMVRANEESEIKSQRLSAVWAWKRKRIETGEKLGK